MKKLVLVLIAFLPFVGFSQPWSIHNVNCDTMSFENDFPTYIYLDTTATNIWQVGNPNKAVFTSALSGSYCLVTDTLNTYPQGNTSSFTIDWLHSLDNSCSFEGGLSLIFVHSVNTDSLSGCKIEASSDSVNWYNIFDAQNGQGGFSAGIYKVDNFNTPPIQTFLFTPDTLFNGELGFKGSYAADTFYLYFNWNIVREVFGSFLRFSFVSDSLSTPADGWMIDDVVLGTYMTFGAVNESLSRSIKTYPNPTSDKLAFDIDEKQFKPTTYSITNIVGQQLSQGTFTAKPLDVSALTPGAYIITLTDAKGNSAAKVFYKQ